MYIIEQNSKTPLHMQLYEALKNDIIENYEIDQKLPSIRKIASTYNLSKNTVESAYRQLYAEGYIESYPKSGYFVSDSNYEYFDTKTSIEITPKKTEQKIKYDFYPVQLPKKSFPLKLWKRLFNKAIDESVEFERYPSGQGEHGLRIQMAEYLTKSRGTKCTPEQIVICSGFADAMGLLAKIVHDRYKSFAIEEPGYRIASQVFKDYGYEIENIPIDSNGLKIKELEESKSKIVYITPTHQYPTGVSMPISNRLKLLKWAQKVDGIIIEDDYDSELTYVNKPIPSLQGLDNHDRVVYIGTIAKALSPSLRVSYMILPNHLIPIFKTLYDVTFPKVSITTQKTLELFMKEGHFERHIRKIRTINKKKHDLMRKCLKEKLKSTVNICSQSAGLSILINPIVPFDWILFEKLALEKSIKIYSIIDTPNKGEKSLRMGFGGFSEDGIIEAIGAFSDIWYKAIIK